MIAGGIAGPPATPWEGPWAACASHYPRTCRPQCAARGLDNIRVDAHQVPTVRVDEIRCEPMLGGYVRGVASAKKSNSKGMPRRARLLLVGNRYFDEQRCPVVWGQFHGEAVEIVDDADLSAGEHVGYPGSPRQLLRPDGACDLLVREI